MDNGDPESEADALHRFSHSLSSSLFNLLTPLTLAFADPQPLSPSHLQSLCQSFSKDISIASTLLIGALHHFHSHDFAPQTQSTVPSAPVDHCIPSSSSPAIDRPSFPPLPSDPDPSPPPPPPAPTLSPIKIKIPAKLPVGSSNGKSVSKPLSCPLSRSHTLGDLFDVPCHKTADRDEACSLPEIPPNETRCSSPAISPHPDQSWPDRPDPDTDAAHPAPKDPAPHGDRGPGALEGPEAWPGALESPDASDSLHAYIQSEIGDGFDQLLEDVAMLVEETKAELGSLPGAGPCEPCAAVSGPAAVATKDLVDGLRRELEAFGQELERQFEGQLLAQYEHRLAQFAAELDRLRSGSEALPSVDGAGQFADYRDSLEKRLGAYGARLKAELEEWKAAVWAELGVLADKTGGPGGPGASAERVQKLEETLANALAPNSLRTQMLAALGLIPSAQQRANLQVFLSQLEAHWAKTRARVEAEEVFKALNESLGAAERVKAEKEARMQDDWTAEGEESNKSRPVTSASVLVDRLVHVVVEKGIWPKLGPFVENMHKYLLSQGIVDD